MMKKVAFLGTAIAMVAAGTAPAAAQFKSAVDESLATQREAKASQQRIEGLDDETSRLLNDYRANLKQFELLARFNKSREAEVEQQAVQLENLQRDLANVENLQRAMQPLMEDMLATLEDFIAADIPFLEAERQKRLERMRTVMTDSNFTAAQRYRLIVEAYTIETEYGRTMDAYKGEIATQDGERAGEFLRVGRSALIFKSSDDSVLKIYDRAAGDFVDLDKSFLADVRLGLRMAKNQTAPALFGIPVQAPVAAE
ncbi:MAG: DUF3450 domain-containing protein [bacterium]